MKDLRTVLVPYDLPQLARQRNRHQLGLPRTSIENMDRLWHLYQLIKTSAYPNAAKDHITAHLSKAISEDEIPREKLYAELTCVIDDAKNFLKSLTREFIPKSMRFPFTSDGLVSPTHDPYEILEMIWEIKGNPDFFEIRSFEAHRLWRLAIRFLLMKVIAEKNRPHLCEITKMLENELFLSGNSIYTDQCLRVRYDPDNYNRFLALESNGTDNFIEYPCLIRTIADEDDHQIKVLYIGREKDDFAIARKMFLKSKATEPIPSDQSGIMIVFFSKEDFVIGNKKIMQIFPIAEAVSDLRANGKGQTRKNEFSSNKFNPERHFRVRVQGGWLEVQMFLFENFYNRNFSLGPENHLFYRLSQVLELFKLFYPKELFGIDWDDEKIKAKLHHKQYMRALSEFHTTENQ